MNAGVHLPSEAYSQPIGDPAGDQVIVPAGDMDLLGWYTFPEGATGAILIASPSPELGTPALGAFLAHVLHDWGLAALVLDPLSAHEAALAKAGKGAGLTAGQLARRLCGALDWLVQKPEIDALQVGIFGHADSEESVLDAAMTCPDRIASVLLVGYPAHLGSQGFEDGLKRGYIIDAPADSANQEALARFAAAWFSNTLHQQRTTPLQS